MTTPEPTSDIDIDGRGPVVDSAAGTVELVSMDPPLLDACKERLTDNVTVHIIGGMSVEGTLFAVNDDLTITVRDRNRRYDIAIAAIAILEGDRR